ncbi:MAG: hypothetical protein J4G15_08485 [Alphaproteobacteria bacterium]|nr:hypothetical protein [Alphaproteobacteria bacterium]
MWRLISSHALAVLRRLGAVPIVVHETAPDDTQADLEVTDESQEAVRLYNEMAE